MQQQLINLNQDLLKLQQQGYDFEVIGGHLIVRQLPYVTPSKQIEYGTLICVLNYASPTRLSAPPDHTIYFAGQTPCDSLGSPLSAIINNSMTHQLTPSLIANHYFSSKPRNGNYPDYYEKIRTYAEIISIHAKMIDDKVTTKPKKDSNTKSD